MPGLLRAILARLKNAANLSNLDAAISSLPTTLINSLQYVSFSGASGWTSGTTTITSVNTAKAQLVWGGSVNTSSGGGTGGEEDRNIMACTLTNATTVTFDRGTAVAATTTGIERACVVEYK